MYLILYNKPGCHLCEDLEEKLAQIKLEIELERRDITTREDWFNAYRYEIPVLFQKIDDQEKPIPRPSPRLNVSQLEQFLQKNLV
jgi:glutaredoxin